MKNISRWASRHVRLASLLLIFCEVLNAINGLLLGMNLLDGLSGGHLLLLAVGLGGGAIFIQTQSAYFAKLPYWTSRVWLFAAFFSNFLLFGILGGLRAQQAQTATTTQTVLGYSRQKSRSDTLVPATELRAGNQAYYEEKPPAKPADQTAKRIGFVLLFLVGLVLTGYALGLACNLTCAGYSGLAFLVGLLGTGIFIGGFFFLSRAFEKVIKPWREMNRLEKRRVRGRTLLLFVVFWAISLLIGNLTRV